MSTGIVLMIVSMCAVFVSGIASLLYGIDDEKTAEETASKIFFVSFAILIFSIVGVCVAESQPLVRDEEPYKVQYLYSLEDNNLTNGRGYYRSVRIETDLYYQYMYKSGSGYKYHKVKANKATVFEDNTTPRVEFYEMRQKWFIFESIYDCYRIYVPKATIAENYNIDLE